MSAARIKVTRQGHTCGAGWECSERGHDGFTTIKAWHGKWTIAAAADAGRAHLCEHHTEWLPEPLPVVPRPTPTAGTYCQGHAGGSGSDYPSVPAPVDLGDEIGREEPAQRFCAAELQNQINGAIDNMNAAMKYMTFIPLVDRVPPCDRPDCPICTARQALQTTHNESRDC